MIQNGFTLMCFYSPDMMMLITVIEYNISGSKSVNLYFSSIRCF